jgi:hypothetical protein
MTITRWPAAAVLLVAGACATTRAATHAGLNEEFRIRTGETAQVEELRLRFVRVTEDSRCPINARCVRAGFAKVAVELRAPGTAAQQAFLQTPDTPTTATYGAYEVEVLDLQPGRDPGAPAPRFEAAFRVRRR